MKNIVKEITEYDALANKIRLAQNMIDSQNKVITESFARQKVIFESLSKEEWEILLQAIAE